MGNYPTVRYYCNLYRIFMFIFNKCIKKTGWRKVFMLGWGRKVVVSIKTKCNTVRWKWNEHINHDVREACDLLKQKRHKITADKTSHS